MNLKATMHQKSLNKLQKPFLFLSCRNLIIENLNYSNDFHAFYLTPYPKHFLLDQYLPQLPFGWLRYLYPNYR